MKRITTAIACLLTAAAIVSCSKASPNDNETDRPSDTSAEITDTKAPATETNATAAGTDEPETQPSEEIPASPASDFEYTISDEGDSIYITKYIGTDENVVIPSEIDGLPVSTLLGVEYDDRYDGVFENSSVKTVAVPDTVVSIEWEAFTNCRELTEVKLSSNVAKLKGNLFENCSKLEKIDLSETKITYLGINAFSGCTSLREIKLPVTLTLVCNGAFKDCTSLLEMRLPKNVAEIENGAFVNCTALKLITIPAGLDLLWSNDLLPRFSKVPSLEKIIFEEGREELDGNDFFTIESDVEIIIPAGVKEFSTDTFFISGSARFVFLGDCPEVIDSTDFYCDATICYDPDTKGWENCVWKDKYTLEPIS